MCSPGDGCPPGMAGGTTAAHLLVKPSLSWEGKPAGQPGTGYWRENSKKKRKGKVSWKLLHALGLGAAPLPAAGTRGDCSNCPHVNHPVPTPGAGTGQGDPAHSWALPSHCQLLGAVSFWFCFDGLGYFFFPFLSQDQPRRGSRDGCLLLSK